jgi:hypothetical protein
MDRFMRQPKLYRGTDGVMRTLSQTAAHLGITVDELRLRWFGPAMPSHIRNDAKYWSAVKRRAMIEGR